VEAGLKRPAPIYNLGTTFRRLVDANRVGEEEMALQMELNKERYVALLKKLIGEVEFLQNNPPKFVPQEDK